MSTLSVPYGSVVYAYVPVTVDAGATNPTGDAVAVAFRPVGDTSAYDWHPAEWVTEDGAYLARVLLGQTPFDLAVGIYQPFTKVSDNPEAPILPATNLLAVTA